MALRTKPRKFQAPMLIGNWKMNPDTLDEAKLLFRAVAKAAASPKYGTIGVAVPTLYLREFLNSPQAKKSKLVVLAQDAFQEKSGAYTGRVSARMLREAGITATLIGHSEMRQAGDTDEIANIKLHAAINEGLTVVVCIGEKVRDDEGTHLHFIRQQLLTTFRNFPKGFESQLVIAYEPVWAIGTGVSMDPTDLHETVLYIRKQLAFENGYQHLSQIPILYGGSVNPENARSFIENGEVQGLLVGKQSLTVQSFMQIYDVLLPIRSKRK
ncbi:MAG TPA: triose-phosphate isomerase [Candidatus Paceibacterota bacterium]|nr:triose-phosphate isomerase [Candidatus Paceibacterota bacterium]